MSKYTTRFLMQSLHQFLFQTRCLKSCNIQNPSLDNCIYCNDKLYQELYSIFQQMEIRDGNQI